MILIGLSGKRGAGKDTVADALMEHFRTGVSYGPSEKIRFSSGLKVMVANFFCGYDHPDNLSLEKFKEAVHVCGKTNRQILQEVGVFMRDLWPDIWVNWFEREASCYGLGPVIVPDVRFPNEVAKIHDLGGKVIRLTRTPFPEDKHESETALDKMECATQYCDIHWEGDTFDAIIDNEKLSIEETNKAVLELVTEKGWC